MRKWIFWVIMCLISILNGLLFFKTSSDAMQRGIEGVDNQGALLFIPILWIMAAIVLFAINLYTLIYGRKIKNDHKIHIINMFYLAKQSKKEILSRMVFFGVTCLLMFFGYSLFAASIWSVAYAVSGGLLFICLYIWHKTGIQKIYR